ncbi:hypothetical protein CL656_07095 [bacterium]|nr:hypothetical protein [bacterium]
MKNNINIFDYLEDSITKNSKLLFKEKKDKFNLDKIFKIVEEFMIKNKLICYGGTALNNILPKEKQFYDYDVLSPDYDFFSPKALEHVKELALIFKKKRYKNILAKSAVHPGTYKLYVNYIPVADVTQINEELYNELLKNTLVRDSIDYAPVSFLRMNLFLELSRPRGDISRWEKIMTRLIKLNESYPFTITNCETNLNFTHHSNKDINFYNFFEKELKTNFNEEIIFIGEYAIKEYSKYFPERLKKITKNKNKLPTFIALSNDAKILCEKLSKNFENNFNMNETNIKIKKIKNIDDFLPKYYNIFINDIHYLTIFQTEGCQNYNILKRKNNSIRIGTLDTMLYYYFMFFYLDFDESFKEHLHCYCFILFYLQENYVINDDILLQRFNLSCIGDQSTIEDIIDFKARKFQTLKNKKTSDEYKKYFLKYVPRNNKTKKRKKN